MLPDLASQGLVATENELRPLAPRLMPLINVTSGRAKCGEGIGYPQRPLAESIKRSRAAPG